MNIGNKKELSSFSRYMDQRLNKSGMANNDQTIIADSFDNVSVVAIRVCGVTYTGNPASFVSQYAKVFQTLDKLCSNYGLQRITPRSGVYLVVSGINGSKGNPAKVIASFALEVKQIFSAINMKELADIRLQIGIHRGPAISGVIAGDPVFYDIWGEAIDGAYALLDTGVEQFIHVSLGFRDALIDHFYFLERKNMNIKGINSPTTFLLTAKKSR